MQRFKLAATVGCVALVGAILAPTASADEWNKKTVMTFSAPVEIPGVHLTGWGVLPAGTYVFKLLDSSSDRHIVQIFNKDETVVYATILAIPNYRLQATDKTVITFRERPAGEPEALRAWFYPGRNWGEEFVYPKAQAMTLAKETNTPVLYTAAEIPVEATEPIQSATAPIVVQMKTAPVLAIKPTGEDVVLAEVVTPPPPATVETAVAPEPATAPVVSSQPAAEPAQAPAPAAALPATASSVPLIGLLGLLSLGGAFALRAFGTRLQ